MMQKIYKTSGGTNSSPKSESQYKNQSQPMMKKNGCGCGKQKKSY
ncbi:hypothetical protein [Peribacillus tepidiphilus]|nr:hypothetical protein [Peribacillus tepidiphilus]